MIILRDILVGGEPVQVELPRVNMVIDPRPNFPFDSYRFQCEYHDNGTTVTLTRTGESYGFMIVFLFFQFRMYDPATETVPSFDSSIYTYLGEEDERAPYGTTVVFIHPSVTVIKEKAFSDCRYIKKCFMHDGVHTIESCAFEFCGGMKTIRLSRSLTYIGFRAFWACRSLKAVFLPPSVNEIDAEAFRYCRNLRIFPLPLNIDISQIGKKILDDCRNYFQTTQIQRYDDDDSEDSNRIHQEIINFYRDQVPPLHKACLDAHVTHHTILQCINIHGRVTVSITDHDGMTPLHILAMNPHANISALLACFDLNMTCAFVQDSRGNTPLDYLRVHHNSIEDHTSLVSSLCMHRHASRGAQRATTTCRQHRK